MTFDDEDSQPPGRGIPGAMQRVFRGAASGVPVVGGLLAELVDGVLEPITTRQLNDWLYDLAKSVKRLEETRDLAVEDLKTPAFVEVAVRAARQAMIDSSTEKREALRNAVLNTALGRVPRTDTRQVLLRHVEELTVSHVTILRLIAEKGKRSKLVRSSAEEAKPLSYYLAKVAPDLAAEETLAEFLCADLARRALVLDTAPPGRLLEHPVVLQDLTPLGDQFLAFIADPLA
jgi:hypothetical protein